MATPRTAKKTSLVDAPKTRRARGTYGMYQRPNGLWAAQIELPIDPTTGKRRRKVITSMDKKALEKRVKDLLLDLRDSGNLPTTNMTLTRWLDYWMINIDRSRPRTREGYRSKIEQYIKPTIGRIRLDQLQPDDIRRVEHEIVRNRNLSSTSARQAYAILSKSLGAALKDGRVRRNVAQLTDAPRKAVYTANVLTSDEGAAVLRHVQHDRLGSRISMALLTGMRQGEVLGLEIDRVTDVIDLSWQLQRLKTINGRLDAPADYEARHLTGQFYLVRPKSSAGWRMIPLVEPLRSIIGARIEVAATEPNPFGLVWTADPKKSRGGNHVVQPLDGHPIDPSWDSKHWDAILRAAGLPDVRLHDARHTAVTLLYDAGVPEHIIQQIVGQSTISVTRNYRHKSPAQLVSALEQLGAMLNSSTPESPPQLRA